MNNNKNNDNNQVDSPFQIDIKEGTKQPLVRVRFDAKYMGQYIMGEVPRKLKPLVNLMREMEEQGALPVLEDGLVCGNCGLKRCFLKRGWRKASQTMLVSKSGKTPGKLMEGDDFVKVLDFDPERWSATYRASSPNSKPTSDLPLYHLMFNNNNIKEFGWKKVPKVVIHGHAIADGRVAKDQGIPISEKITLVSTPEDAEELRKLFIQYPYPQYKCYIRLGHGYFILGDNIQELSDIFEKLVKPHLNEKPPSTSK
eukprot:TRINITY_DN10663_c0_g1_i2.p1 TRINITY_DN10663_c0_g1~~TRINITY_DN10663_c0_g1_i2.p1  ORF type:complete len:255 (-),score=34.95 TRINITY_DN10663_c0_g1_i2:302-1066(-)